MRKNILFLFLVFITPTLFGQSESSEKKAVLATVQQFFDSMTARDTLATSQVLLRDGNYYATRQDTKGFYNRMNTNRQYLMRLQRDTTQLEERMWNPTVLVHRTVATVWTPYEFKVNGKVTHCGIDSFSLIKTTEGWKISHIIYTVEPEGCESMKKYKVEDHLR